MQEEGSAEMIHRQVWYGSMDTLRASHYLCPFPTYHVQVAMSECFLVPVFTALYGDNVPNPHPHILTLNLLS